ncbi:MAG: insulinase family protein, partial [Rhodothermales bacterium]|nr:insulinase family protein [Rhodothermales bacterium]
DKKLAGQAVSVSPYVGEREEGLSGRASPEDLETLFQLVHLYFTEPRQDPAAFAALQERIRTFLQNRSQQPEAAFSDTLQVTLGQYHPRRLPFTMDDLAALDAEAALDFYRDRFADASDFTFVLVGAFEPEQVEPLVEQYLATLPATGREEEPRDLGIEPPEGVVEKTVRRGIEPKARVQLVFSGDLQETDGGAAARQERYRLGALADALRIRLREELREERGGVYGVGVSANADRMDGTYTVSIGFGADPERVEDLTAAVFEQIEAFQQEGPDAQTIAKVKEQDRRAQEVGLEENPTWLGALAAAYRYGEDPQRYLDRTDLVDALTAAAVQAAAQAYLDSERYVRVVLLPEGEG